MYMTSDVGGLFRSDNGGKTWRMLHGALPPDAASYSVRGFAVHPKNANRILAGVGSPWGSSSGVWVSSDAGESWKQTLKARFDGNGWYRSTGNVVVISPQNPNRVLAAPLGGGLARSEDGGRTWARSGPDDINPTHILFDRTNARRIWVCARPWDEVKVKRSNGQEVGLRGGLFLSQDAGKTWTQINNDSPGEMHQDPANPTVIWGLMREQQVVRSTDGGRTWTSHSTGLAPWAMATRARTAPMKRFMSARIFCWRAVMAVTSTAWTATKQSGAKSCPEKSTKANGGAASNPTAIATSVRRWASSQRIRTTQSTGFSPIGMRSIKAMTRAKPGI
jgi:hypothetical protein